MVVHHETVIHNVVHLVINHTFPGRGIKRKKHANFSSA